MKTRLPESPQPCSHSLNDTRTIWIEVICNRSPILIDEAFIAHLLVQLTVMLFFDGAERNGNNHSFLWRQSKLIADLDFSVTESDLSQNLLEDRSILVDEPIEDFQRLRVWLEV